MGFRGPLFACILVLAGGSGASTKPSAPAKSGATPSPSTFVVSAGRSYNLIGDWRLETQFSDMHGFISPSVSGTAPDGQFVFNPPAGGNEGGKMEITFRNLQATLQFTCHVGKRLVADVLVSGPPGIMVRTKVSTVSVGGGNLVKFTTPPMGRHGDLVVQIWNSAAQDVWNLERCDVTGTSEI